MTENTSASLVDSLMEDSSDEDILAAMRAAIVRLERYDESTDDELNALFLRKGFNAVLLPILRKLYRANYPRTTGGVPKGPAERHSLPPGRNILEILRAAAADATWSAAWEIVAKNPLQLATCRELDPAAREMFPDFVCREDSEKSLLNHYAARFKTVVATKADALHAAVAGAPGTGKTRFVDEVCDWNKLSADELRKKAGGPLSDEFVQSVQNWVQIRISYNGYSKATDTDYKHPVHGFLCRVACAYLFHSCNLSAISEALFKSGVLGDSPVVEDLFVAIVQDHTAIHNLHGMRVSVFLGVDELLLADPQSKDPKLQKHDSAAEITSQIGKLVESQRVLVHQLTTTLDATLLADMNTTLSRRQIFWVLTHPVTTDGILTMIKRYETGGPGLPEQLPKLLEKQFMRQMLSDCGGHPRTLEIAIKVAIEMAGKDSVTWTARAAYSALKSRLGAFELPFELLSAVLLERKVKGSTLVPATNITYVHYVRNGTLSNSTEDGLDANNDQFVPRLPVIKISGLAEQMLSSEDRSTRQYEVARTLHYMLDGEEDFSWLSYERFHAGWEHLMDVLLAGTTVYLRDLYKGAVLGRAVARSKFKFPPFTPPPGEWPSSDPVVDLEGERPSAGNCGDGFSRTFLIGKSNPGYDVLCVRDGIIKYIETRYSDPESTTMGTKAERDHKYKLWLEQFVDDEVMDKLHVRPRVEHVFVMALMRDANRNVFDDVPRDAVLIAKDALLKMYGKSLGYRPQFTCLGQLATPQLDAAEAPKPPSPLKISEGAKRQSPPVDDTRESKRVRR